MYAKSIAAFISAAVGMFLTLGVDVGLSAEVIGSISVIASTFLVWLLPNKPV